MKLKVWGCRGSISVPGPTTIKYGGNTTCYEIRSDGGELLIIDAGTGIRELGGALMAEMPLKAHLVFSHTHYDHVIGYPFFVPFFIPTNEFEIYGPALFDKSFKSVMKDLLAYSFFPVRLDEVAAKMNFHDMKEEEVQMGVFQVAAAYANHPVTTLAYRIAVDGKSLVFSGDTEPYINHLDGLDNVDEEEYEEVEEVIAEQTERWLNFIRGADLVLHDAQYTLEEYPKFKGWGHTAMNVAIDNCEKAGVKKILLTHHDPRRTDAQIDDLTLRWKDYAKEQNYSIEIEFAVETKNYDV